MSLIDISNLTFAYDGNYDNVFENVSFQIDTDWKLGFTGRNGRGKTTFLNLLMGRHEYKGKISHSVSFDYFPFSVDAPNDDTLKVVNTVLPGCAYWRLLREMSLLELDESVLGRTFSTLSNGEQTKILLAVLFLRENQFLLIDEPTNHLDMHGREIVGGYLNRKKGFILVSHDRTFLDGCTDHTLSINKSNIEVVRGNFSSWYRNKERQDSFELSENEKLKKEIKRLKKSAKEMAQWSERSEGRKIGFDPKKTEKSIGRRSYEAAKSKKMMKREKAVAGRQRLAAEEKSELLKNIESSENLKLEQLDYHTKSFALLKDVAISYVNGKVSFAIEKGDRIALLGKNGSGKSSIVRLICGEKVPYTGVFQIGKGLIISYVSQNAAFLEGNLSDYAKENGIDEGLFKAILRKLDFSREQFDKDMKKYSAGQKKKVLIAKSLCQKAHLHIWDEPLNYIDVISRMQIEKLILDFKPTILFVEHDKAFCDRVATKTINLSE